MKDTKLTPSERVALKKMLRARAPSEWKLTDSVSDRQLVGMLYDGLAYGNWPWVSFTTGEILKSEA